MPDWIAQEQIARLEASVGSDPGASEFPALAEALRSAGRLEAAERVARRGLERKPGCLEGGVVLALVLLDQGRVDDARGELASRAAECLSACGIAASDPIHGAVDFAAGAGGFDGEVTDGELDQAFDTAEPDRDQLVDADRVAQDALRDAALDQPEELLAASSDPVFATKTMAELLERQGDSEGASQIRATLVADADGAAAASPSHHGCRQRTIEMLEMWLANLRGAPR